MFPCCTQHRLSHNIEAEKGHRIAPARLISPDMHIRDLEPSIVAVFGQPPADIDLANSQVHRDNAAVIILLVLGIIAVGLRFIARLAVRNPFRLDDWLILVSLVREQDESIRNWSSSANIDIATYQVFVAATAGLSLAGTARDTSYSPRYVGF